jgi:tetratricopeptide (TPR) repeat protein
MGRAFYDVMAESRNLPKTEDPKVEFNKQDSITCSEFVFSDLDSIIGNNIITLLKNDWPFTIKRKTQLTRSLFKINNFLDSIALEYIEGKISWADAHLNAAIGYLRRDDIKAHIRQMDILIYQYPALKDYNSALKYFYENKKINPGDFTLRRVGLIEVLNKNFDKGIDHLNKIYQSNPNDTEVLYNLAIAYLNKKDFQNALNKINETLHINSDYPGAGNLKRQLVDSLRVIKGI